MIEMLNLSKMAIQENRVKLLKYSLVIALLCTLTSLFFQQWHNSVVPLIVTLLLNLVFLFGINVLFLKALKHEKYGWTDFYQIKDYVRQLLPIFAIYITVLVVSVVVIRLLLAVTGMVLILPALISLSVIMLNCVNHLTMFQIVQDQQKPLSSLKQAFQLFFKSKKLILHVILKTIIILLVGALLVYCINVLVYAPQINAALYGAQGVDLALIDKYFSSDLSYMIQSIGMQLVISYIAIVTGLTYGTYYLQQTGKFRKAQ